MPDPNLLTLTELPPLSIWVEVRLGLDYGLRLGSGML